MTDFGLYGRLDQLQERVAKLEQVLDAVVAATGVTLPPGLAPSENDRDPVTDQIADLLRAGKRLEAVKVANKELKLGLREATEYVGRIEGSI